jgi:Zn-dependent protease/CBS domain-containing protein
MRWALRLGAVGGVAVYVHLTCLLFLAWLTTEHVLRDGPEALLTEGAFALLAGASVALHEAGHALAAWRLGLATREITLFPAGGLARLERQPAAWQDALVALAGPAVSALAAAALYAAWGAGPAPSGDVADGPLASRLLWVNVWLAGLNLLPALPLDGGRLLRALLTARGDPQSATYRAALLGQALGLALGFYGLFAHPLLLFVGLFVWMGAVQEAGPAQVPSALAGVTVARAMTRDVRRLAAADTLADATRLLLSGFAYDLPVLDGGKLVGLLARSDLLAALARSGEGPRVEEVMRREFSTARPDELLDAVLPRLAGGLSVPVVEGGRLVGLLTTDGLGDLLLSAGRKR